jgi:uncharacterized membrane protein
MVAAVRQEYWKAREMTKNSAHMLAAVFSEREHADVILNMLESMHRAGTVALVDAAMVTKDEQGKLQIEETHDLTAKKGARRGAIIMGSMAVLFPPTIIASAVAGGALGALAGKLRDSGIKTKQLREIAEQLEPDQALIVVLAKDDSLAKVQSALGSYGGQLIVVAIDEEALIELQKAAVIKAGTEG